MHCTCTSTHQPCMVHVTAGCPSFPDRLLKQSTLTLIFALRAVIMYNK